MLFSGLVRVVNNWGLIRVREMQPERLFDPPGPGAPIYVSLTFIGSRTSNGEQILTSGCKIDCGPKIPTPIKEPLLLTRRKFLFGFVGISILQGQ
jgi:hypothetical protein